MKNTYELDNFGSSPIKRNQNRSWKNLLISKPFDWVTTSLYLTNCLIWVFNYTNQDNSTDKSYLWQGILVFLGMISLTVIDRVDTLKFGDTIPLKVRLTLIFIRVFIVFLVSFLTNDGNSFFFGTLILLVIAALYFGMKGAYLMAAGTTLFAVIAIPPNASLDSTKYWSIALAFGVFLIIGLTFAKTIVEEKALRHKAEQLVEELDMSHRQITKMATLEERNRVARDIHDSLGHYLTVVNVQLEKALAFRAKDPEEAEQAVHNAKRLADQALEEVRKSVGALRNNTEVFSFTHSVAELVENVQSHLLKVDFEQIGNEEGFSRETLIVLFRAVQEGLTNIQRHAGATKADIKISFGTKEGFLLISDNGQGFEVANKLANGRFGLSGLQERLERIGGAIKIDSHPGQGTHLSITVPKNSGVLTTPLQTR